MDRVLLSQAPPLALPAREPGRANACSAPLPDPFGPGNDAMNRRVEHIPAGDVTHCKFLGRGSAVMHPIPDLRPRIFVRPARRIIECRLTESHDQTDRPLKAGLGLRLVRHEDSAACL